MTTNEFDKINFKGQYKAYTPNGVLIVYNKNDAVTYNGKTYIATKTLSQVSPEHGEKSGWILFGGSATTGVQFYWGETAPSKPNIGDEWFNITTAKTYKYLSDGDTDQWVNIY